MRALIRWSCSRARARLVQAGEFCVDAPFGNPETQIARAARDHQRAADPHAR
jgi:hypothetical protein